jgi:hypothetical protein
VLSQKQTCRGLFNDPEPFEKFESFEVPGAGKMGWISMIILLAFIDAFGTAGWLYGFMRAPPAASFGRREGC